MAGIDMPDTLTPEQARKLGLLPELPDTLTPEEAQAHGLTGGDAPPAAEPPPGVFDRLGRGFAALGRTIAAGAGAAAETWRHPIDTITNPARRREFLRGMDNMVTLGYGQRLADRIGRAAGDAPDVQLAATADQDMVDAPGFREFGGITGAFTSGVVSTIAKGGGQLIKLGTAGLKATSAPARVALGAARGAGGYAATAPVTAALSAEASGDRAGAAREAATDPAGIALSAATGGGASLASKLVESAPARVAKRRAKDITTGEQNAKKSTTLKVQERAGEDGDRLSVVLAEDPALEKLVSVKAGSSPDKVGKAVTGKIEQINGELDDMFAAMEKAGRVVTPTEIAVSFDKIAGRLLKDGHLDALNVLRKARAQFLSEYGNFGKLSADTLRGLKGRARTAAFDGNAAVDPLLKRQVSKEIWAVYSDAIERAAANADGVDIKRLRKLNQDVSVLIPAELALEERAAMGAAGRRSIGEHIGRAALAGAGLAHGGVKEMVLGLVAPEAIRLGGEGIRAADYALAKKFRGVAPDVSSGVGARAASLDYAARVAQGMKGGASLADAVKAADEGR
jgi:hypothetical protein